MILAECAADTLLAKMLLVPALNLSKEDIDRSCNMGEVSNRLRKYYSNRLAIGIIDKDKNMGRTFKTFKSYPKHDLSNMVHLWNEDKHHLIYFKNGLEHFINKTADQSGIEREKYPGLQTIDQIRSNTKDMFVADNKSFVNFLNSINTRNPENFKKFINWIAYILKKK